MDPLFFRAPEEFRAWLREHHATEREALLGFYKKRSGVTGFTQAQAVDEALCFGWIDGHLKTLDENRYTARFTPRTPSSIWSAVNIRRAERLIAEGRMEPPGLTAFTERDPRQAGKYSFENQLQSLAEADEARFREHPAAWAFFQAQPFSYRRPALWWVVSAKKDETRQRRLATLIADSAAGRRLKHLVSPARAKRAAEESHG